MLKTKIHSLAFGGFGVGRINGKICFVKGALPTEEVSFEIIKETKNYIQANVLDIYNISQYREKAVCKHYFKCGGCQLQHISYKQELFYKEQQLIEIFDKIGKIKNIKVQQTIGSKEKYFYRSTITLHNNKNYYGFFCEDNKTIINIDKCYLVDKHINKFLINNSCNNSEKKRITIKSDYNGNIWTNYIENSNFINKYKEIYLFMSTGSFSQSNIYICEKIIDTLNAWLDNEKYETIFFDIYCGIGLFSFALKEKFSLFLGIDNNKNAIDCAKKTKKEFNIYNTKFFIAEAKNKLFSIFNKYKSTNNILFVNPPRIGLEKKLISQLCGFDNINKLYYLSCNPATLARDSNILVNNGFTINKVVCFDMFPRTKFFETLVEFIK